MIVGIAAEISNNMPRGSRGPVGSGPVGPVLWGLDRPDLDPLNQDRLDDSDRGGLDQVVMGT